MKIILDINSGSIFLDSKSLIKQTGIKWIKITFQYFEFFNGRFVSTIVAAQVVLIHMTISTLLTMFSHSGTEMTIGLPNIASITLTAGKFINQIGFQVNRSTALVSKEMRDLISAENDSKWPVVGSFDSSEQFFDF